MLTTAAHRDAVFTVRRNTIHPFVLHKVCTTPTSICPSQSTHHADIATPVRKETPAVIGSTFPTPPPQHACLHAHIAPHNKGTVYLKTAITTVCDECSAYSTTGHLLFNDGSQRSFIIEDWVKALHIQPIRQESINISGFGGAENAIKNVDIVRLAIDCNDEKIKFELLVTPNITKPISLQNSELQGINALCNLRLANPITDNAFFDVSMLIGGDYYYRFVENEIITSDAGPVAVKSKLGYLISGPLTSASARAPTSTSTTLLLLNSPRNDNLPDLWSLESLGIKPPVDSDNDSFIREYCDSTIKKADGMYSVKLPWKPHHDELSNNKALAYHRTRATVRQLEKTPTLLDTYGSIIDEYEKHGFIEKVKKMIYQTIALITSHITLSQKKPKTTRLGIVFDCSSHQKGKHV